MFHHTITKSNVKKHDPNYQELNLTQSRRFAINKVEIIQTNLQCECEKLLQKLNSRRGTMVSKKRVTHIVHQAKGMGYKIPYYQPLDYFLLVLIWLMKGRLRNFFKTSTSAYIILVTKRVWFFRNSYKNCPQKQMWITALWKIILNSISFYTFCLLAMYIPHKNRWHKFIYDLCMSLGTKYIL